MEPRELLEKVTALIEKDVSHIEKLVTQGKLDKDSAMDLARYSTALLHIVKDREEAKKSERKTLEQLSDEELREMAKQFL